MNNSDNKLERAKYHVAKGERDRAKELLFGLVRERDYKIQALSYLADIVKRENQMEDSLKVIDIALEENSHLGYFIAGSILTWKGYHADSIVFLKRSINLKPSFTQAYISIARAYQSKKESRNAYLNFLIALEQKPTDLNALKGTARNGKQFLTYEEYFPLYQKYYQATGKPGVFLDLVGVAEFMSDSELHHEIIKKGIDDDIDLLFLKYKLLDKRDCLLECNKRKFRISKYNIESDCTLFKALTTRDAEISPVSVTDPIKPIFIVGMPRSGTSLLEKMLSVNDSITGCGELPYIAEFSARYFDRKSSYRNHHQIKSEYLRKLTQLGSSEFYIDKMPHNFRYIGMIKKLFPSAIIINISRNPLATIWSNFTTHFSTGKNKSLGYSDNLEICFQYYIEYLNLVKYYNNNYPIFNLRYEDLISNPGLYLRKITEHIGIEYNDRMIETENNDFPTNTASKNQVTQKIYSHANEEHLKHMDLMDELISHYGSYLE